MTPSEHDNSESAQEQPTTELYPFAREYPRAAGDTRPDVPTMEQLPDPDALPDPGYPEMAAPAAEPEPEQPGGPAWTAGRPAPAAGEAVSTGPFNEPGSRSWPQPPGWPPASRSSPPPVDEPTGPRPAWSPDPYAAPRAPDDAPPLRGPSVPWTQVRSAADYEAADYEVAPEPLTAQGPAPEPLYPEPLYQEPLYQEPLYPEPPAPEPPVPEPLPAPPSLHPHPHSRPRPHPEARWAAPALQEQAAGSSPEEITQRPTSDMLTSDLLLPGRRATPDGGWRRTVYRATGGLVRVGDSSATVRRRDLVSRIRTPVAGGHHRVAVLSLKGGVGKTTVTVGLGATLASLRGDRVIAVDGNPDRGTLSDKVQLETTATIRDLLDQRALVARYADVRAFTSQTPSRLEILASDRDPGVSVAFSADDYRAVVGVLEHYYSVCITDCGTGLLHSAMAGILELADQIVLVSSPSVDGARSASATLDWLEAHEYGDLVRGGVVVLSNVRRKSRSTVDLDRLEQHFAARCRAVVRVPYDTHLEEGAEVELEYLNTETAEAYLTLAALVADGFARPRRPVAADR
jgi:MinD-like ATPase involved in chromosome partitioning or flagellar assembly